MNEYEEKQERRRERLLRRSENEKQEAERRFKASDDIVSAIPFGQPILIGHHSEKGHRARLKRSHNHMDKGCEALAKSKDYARQAAAVGKGGISGDDPDALDKLREKLAGLEAERETEKDINRYYKKHGTIDGYEMSDERRRNIQRRLSHSWISKPYPFLKNIGANIRSVKERIESLERREIERNSLVSESDVVDISEFVPGKDQEIRTGTASDGTGYTITEHPEDEGGRIWFEFDGKPSRDVCKNMRKYGWKWSPARGAWVRNLNTKGRAAASYTNP